MTQRDELEQKIRLLLFPNVHIDHSNVEPDEMTITKKGKEYYISELVTLFKAEQKRYVSELIGQTSDYSNDDPDDNSNFKAGYNQAIGDVLSDLRRQAGVSQPNAEVEG